MDNLTELIKKYSIKYDKKLKNICAPLTEHLEISSVIYYFVDSEGNFGTITNSCEYLEFYYFNQFYLTNPFFSHPDLFRSGYMYCPCTFDSASQEVVQSVYRRNHLFLTIESHPGLVEGFCFSDPKFNAQRLTDYLPYLDTLKKFSQYFKRENQSIIDRIRAEKCNIKKIRGAQFFQAPNIPLLRKDPTNNLLNKELWGLSFQEERCHELFKQGHSAQASAAKLGLSRRTVEHYLDSVKDKLGCLSKWDLLNY